MAAKALGKSGTTVSLALLETKLREDQTVADRLSYADAIAAISPEGETFLTDILQDPKENPVLRSSAAAALGKLIGKNGRILPVVRGAMDDTDITVRASAIDALAFYGDSNAIKIVLAGIAADAQRDGTSTGPIDLWSVSQRLENMGVGATDTIIQILENRDLKDRADIVRALKNVALQAPQQANLPKIMDSLRRSLYDPDPLVREESATVLGLLPPTDSIDASASANALVHLLQREIRPGADYDKESRPEIVNAAFDALIELGAYTDAALPALMQWADDTNPFVRRNTIQAIGKIGPRAIAAKSRLFLALSDSNSSVRIAAAHALEGLDLNLDELGGAFTAVVLDFRVHEICAKDYVAIADFRQPYIAVPASAGELFRLPPFPWPNPPHPSHLAVFGRELPDTLLGTDSTTLGQVSQHLFSALVRTDPGFEGSLFSVPDGFAIEVKMERISSDGYPIQGDDRWARGDIFPRSFSEYISDLFFDKPGYFRVFVFVVTSQAYRADLPSTKPLPSLEQGGANLPRDIAKLELQGENKYLLVYSFQRTEGGQIRPVGGGDMSAAVQLQRSGIEACLATAP